MNPKVDQYLATAKKWQEELRRLRMILLDCQLTEELKWGKPCYTFESHNVVIILPLKASCALLFCKGALLKDPHGVLIQPTENTQSARQIRFSTLQEIIENDRLLETYIREATEIEKAGLEVNFTKEVKVPDELRNQLTEKPVLRSAFEALTPGRQRAYALYFAAPKQAKTRESRIERCTQRILDGKGLDDE